MNGSATATFSGACSSERCKAHGLRKAAARRLAEAGCSASEIMAITGHKTLAEVERYTRAAEQERLARRAIKRQSENRSGKLADHEVANTTDELPKINSLTSKVALPTGLQGLSDFSGLLSPPAPDVSPALSQR